MARIKVTTASLVAILLAGTSPLKAEDGTWIIQTGDNLGEFLDCHEAAGTTLISAHRGGPSPGLPENAIETMDAVLTAHPTIMEVDIAQSRDGVHFLMHDRTLDRTTNGQGVAADLNWSAISQLRLKDADGWVTPYRVPTLRSALEWAKGRTVLQLDFKRSASHEVVINEVRNTGNAQNVILIAYSVETAAKLHSLAPEMMISLSMEKPSALAEVEAAGLPKDRLIAFTGTRLVRPDLYKALDDQDIEVIFGTLGWRNSIDQQLDRLGMEERYAELGENGVDIIATDRPRAAAKALEEAKRLPVAGACGVGRSADQ
ncbi:MAG: glycerophosphodiester phosphodiesterase family protein [Pseudomonadota bacterium]